MTEPTWKAQKEQFVSGLTGGSVLEINKVTLVAATAYALWAILQSRFRVFARAKYDASTFAADFALNGICLLLSITLHATRPILLNGLLILPTLIIYVAFPASRSSRTKTEIITKKKKLAFISVYRGSMMLVTCFAILAVDFRVFPRRFAKVETWGTSLMDLGVGSFVFSSGLISSRNLNQDSQDSIFVRARRAITQSGVIIFLGAVRVALTKGSDYPEHVTEYGVHWNFFFTLGFLPIALILYRLLTRDAMSSGIGAIVLAVCYQIALTFSPLKVWALSAPRVTLISENREGIVSFIGYFSIFLAGMDLGTRLFDRAKSRRHSIFILCASCSLWLTLYLISTIPMDLAVSRRLANLPYLAWVCAYNCGFLVCYLLVEMAFIRNLPYNEQVPYILEAFNTNGLTIFLIANIFTGLINLSLDTLKIETPFAMAILVGYGALLCTMSVLLQEHHIKLV